MSLPREAILPQARQPRGAGLWPALVLLFCLPSNAATPLKDQPHLRRPVAAAWIEPGKLLAVANCRSGSISIVDIPGRKVLTETVVGEKLADIVTRPSGGRLLAVDELRHELILLEADGDSLRVINRTPVNPFPVSVAISPTGSRIAVASLWSRKLTIFEPNIDLPAAAGQLRLLAEIELPFNARRQVVLPDDQRLIVADAFGGGLALVDIRRGRVDAVRQTDALSISGLALSHDGKSILVGLQRRLPAPLGYAAVKREPGTYIGNVLERLSSSQRGLSALTLRSLLPHGARCELEVDARSIAVLRDDLIGITPSGGTQVLFLNQDYSARGQHVGRGPVQILVSHDGGGLFPASPIIVVNRFDDSLTLLDAKKATVVGTIRIGPNWPLAPADRGEELFYDTRFAKARHGWMSCHSCHSDGHTNHQLADTLGDGTTGTPKRIPTLLGTRLTDPWAWNGQVRSLNEQVRKSLETTMHAKTITPQQIDDITAFLHTLPPPPPIEPATDEPEDTAQLARGSALFNRLGCARCHVPPLTYTSSDTYDVGLEDEKGLKKFNPPSLRGVSQGYAFFHDGRAKSLEEVLTVHGHQLERTLEKNELADLLRFLRSL